MLESDQFWYFGSFAFTPSITFTFNYLQAGGRACKNKYKKGSRWGENDGGLMYHKIVCVNVKYKNIFLSLKSKFFRQLRKKHTLKVWIKRRQIMSACKKNVPCSRRIFKKTVDILKEIKKLKSFKEKLPYLIKVESKLIFYFFWSIFHNFRIF